MSGYTILGNTHSNSIGYEVPADKFINFVTPGMELDEMNKIGAEMWRLDSDIKSFKPSQQEVTAFSAFKNAWSNFVDEYKSYYESNKGFVSRLWGSKMDKIIEYGKAINQWRDKFEKFHSFTGGQASASSPTPISKEEKPLLDQFLGSGTGSTVKWVVVGVVSVLFLGIAGSFILPVILRSKARGQ